MKNEKVPFVITDNNIEVFTDKDGQFGNNQRFIGRKGDYN